jgi:putative transposase
MDEAHLGAALHYVALNPVRAGLVQRAADWPWSNAPAHLGRIKADGLTATEPVLSRYPDFAAILAAGGTRRRRCGCDRPSRSAGRSAAPTSWTGSNARAAAHSLLPDAGGSPLKVHCHRN